jgi:hypothetical protein
VIPIGLAILPEVPDIIRLLVNAFKKYPQITPDQVQQVVVAAAAHANAECAATNAEMAADEKVHPPTP